MSARSAPDTGAPPRVVDLVTHSAVEILAAPAAIWPFLLDTDGWKRGATPVRESGEPNAVGEVRVARQVFDGVEFALAVETVALEPPTRKVVRLTGPFTEPGWAAWQLVPHGGSTLAIYDVYSRHDIGRTGMSADDYLAGERLRFDAELSDLKRLVESGVSVR